MAASDPKSRHILVLTKEELLEIEYMICRLEEFEGISESAEGLLRKVRELEKAGKIEERGK